MDEQKRAEHIRAFNEGSQIGAERFVDTAAKDPFRHNPFDMTYNELVTTVETLRAIRRSQIIQIAELRAELASARSNTEQENLWHIRERDKLGTL